MTIGKDYDDEMAAAVWVGMDVPMEPSTAIACPRCGEIACIDPDSKGCSDNVISRLQRDLAEARARIAALERTNAKEER